MRSDPDRSAGPPVCTPSQPLMIEIVCPQNIAHPRATDIAWASLAPSHTRQPQRQPHALTNAQPSGQGAAIPRPLPEPSKGGLSQKTTILEARARRSGFKREQMRGFRGAWLLRRLSHPAAPEEHRDSARNVGALVGFPCQHGKGKDKWQPTSTSSMFWSCSAEARAV